MAIAPDCLSGFHGFESHTLRQGYPIPALTGEIGTGMYLEMFSLDWVLSPETRMLWQMSGHLEVTG